jgi:hypothetical protein
MTDDKLETAIARGARAKELLESDLMQDIFTRLEADYIAGWRNTCARDTDVRERLWLAVQVIALVKDHLIIVANNGKLAQAELDRLTQASLRSLRKLGCTAPGWGSCGDPLTDPHPQPLPTRGGGEQTECAALELQSE